MPNVTYDVITPNIADVRVSGASVTVFWKCPSTGRAMGESAAYMQRDDSLAGRMQSSVKRDVVSELLSGAANFVGNLLGGAAGRVVRNAAWTAASDMRSRADSAIDYDEDARRTAIVAAFASVQASFEWDDGAQRFVAR